MSVDQLNEDDVENGNAPQEEHSVDMIEDTVVKNVEPEVTPEPEPAAKPELSFEEELTNFFNKHRKSKLKLVPQLVEQYSNQREEVMAHLNFKYGSGKRVKTPKVEGNTNGGAVHDSLPSEEAPQKSKKKLIMIIVLVVVLVGCGIAGWMMMGAGHSGGAEVDNKATTSEPVKNVEEDGAKEESPVEQAQPEETSAEDQAKIDSVEAVLSASTPATATTDSTAAAAPGGEE